MADKASSSKEDKAKPTGIQYDGMKPIDKVYYSRVLLALIAGLVSGYFYKQDSFLGILFLLFFYMLSAVIYKTTGWASGSAVYTHGVGTFVFVWFVTFSLYITFLLP